MKLKGILAIKAAKGKILPLMVGSNLVRIEEKPIEIDSDQLSYSAKLILKRAIKDMDVELVQKSQGGNK
ncbi:MAG: hypothetical protein CMB99_15925 [Flavobacteriaceae bacterium]|nr:hypothetical protein [Flavobacteriaceae bacterium]